MIRATRLFSITFPSLHDRRNHRADRLGRRGRAKCIAHTAFSSRPGSVHRQPTPGRHIMDEQWRSPYSPGGEYDGVKYGGLPVEPVVS